jgi:hypothetical protein
MLSLNVASERADLARVERQIVAAKQDIRTLQTELGTRGRLAQLEQWNADVLALSAPGSTQFLENEVKLARFDQRKPTVEERTDIHLAAAEVASEQPKIEAPVVHAAASAQPQLGAESLIHRASLQVPAVTSVKPEAGAKRIDPALAKEISAAAKIEAVTGGQ